MRIPCYRAEGPSVEEEIENQLNENKKVAIVSMRSEKAKLYYDQLKAKYPTKTIYYYTGKSDDIQKRDHLSDVKTHWGEADVVLYSPTIEAGVNFDCAHFYKIYGIVSSGSTSQMLARIRKVEDNNILILNESLNDRPTSNYCEIGEVKEALIHTRSNILKYEYVINEEGEEVRRRKDFDTYDLISLYNHTEALNKEAFYFMPYLRELGLSKGYQFKTTEEVKKKTPKEKSLGRITDIINAANMMQAEKDDLEMKQKKGEASESDKLKLEKYWLKRRIGVDLLDETIMAQYYKKEDTIDNFKYLIDDENIRDCDESKSEMCKACVKIVNSVITQLGFTDVYDNKRIPRKVFVENLKTVTETNELFTDTKSSQALFKLTKGNVDKTSQRAVLGYINTILSGYNIKVEFSYIQGKNKVLENSEYKLAHLNSINELMYYQYNKGYSIKDRRGIIKVPSEYKFSHLLKVK